MSQYSAHLLQGLCLNVSLSKINRPTDTAHV
jgi:hypothetical protein